MGVRWFQKVIDRKVTPNVIFGPTVGPAALQSPHNLIDKQIRTIWTRKWSVVIKSIAMLIVQIASWASALAGVLQTMQSESQLVAWGMKGLNKKELFVTQYKWFYNDFLKYG